MIDPRAVGNQLDMMRASIALDVLRLPHHDDDDEDFAELRTRAAKVLMAVLDAT